MVCLVGLLVADAAEAYRISVEHGAVGVTKPQTLRDAASGQELVVSEVKAYGDCVMRFVSGSFEVGDTGKVWGGMGRS